MVNHSEPKRYAKGHRRPRDIPSRASKGQHKRQMPKAGIPPMIGIQTTPELALEKGRHERKDTAKWSPE